MRRYLGVSLLAPELGILSRHKKARQEGCRSWQAKEERANVSFLTVQPARIGTTMGNFPFLSSGRKTGRRQNPKHSSTITQIDGYESLVFFPCFGSRKKHLGKCPRDTHMKTKTLTIPVYETPFGAPTCCRDLSKGEVCRFLHTQRMGLEMTCLFAPQSGKRGEPLEKDADGYLVPSLACPFHSA
jgi:hypothetical protein